MAAKLEAILEKVSKKSTPSSKDRNRVLALARTIKQNVEEAARNAGATIKVRVEGSVAKNTWLKDSPDIDVFMRVPPATPREAFATVYLDIAKSATADAEQVERFAEHPYLESIIYEAGFKTRVNIVPCYQVKKGEWKSATDRTPFHTDYVKPLLNEVLCNEIRLLKQFMKGIGVYGAEIKVGGFSGYLCELLVLYYNSFLQVITAAANWKIRTYIDLEGHYEGRKQELSRLFPKRLTVVDPVDPERNVASSVRQEQLDEFVAASRIFQATPSEKLFFPLETKPFKRLDLVQEMSARGSTLVFVVLGSVKAVPDILWGQLYKFQRTLRKMLSQHGFNILRDAVWSDEENLNIVLFEVEHSRLPAFKKHLGPPLSKKDECKRFLEKHQFSPRTLSGPRVESGRWVVETKREHSTITGLLAAKLKSREENTVLPSVLRQAAENKTAILVNEEIASTYSRNREFARFLTKYIKGQPKWLI